MKEMIHHGENAATIKLVSIGMQTSIYVYEGVVV